MDQTDEYAVSWIDYTIFFLMLTMSAAIGLYHGLKKGRKNTVEEYLFAGRNISVVPIFLSNMASNISSIALVLLPVESYFYGGQVFFLSFGEFLGAVMMYNFYLPVFYHLKYTSIFEYLERRFNRPTRLLGSAIYTVTQVFYALVIAYSSCLAITKAIPIPFYTLTTTVCIVCTIYTVMGGIRGIVWADFAQAICMYLCMLSILGLSIYNVGGIDRVIEIADRGGRLDILNLDPSIFSRCSVWSITLSSAFFSFYNNCTNPGIIQRYLTIGNFSKAKLVVCLSGFANVSITFVAISMGIIIYTQYYDCDPLMSKRLTNIDQLIPFHVLRLANKLPGLCGLFLAGILSAALSSLSTMMNSLSAIIFDDFVRPYLHVEWDNARINLWLKAIVISLGLIVTFSIFGISASAGTFQLFRTLTSLTGGLIIFIFAFGLFYRRANKKSAIIGAVAGVIVSAWIGIGIQNAVAQGRIKYTTKVVSVEGCPANLTESLNLNKTTFGYPGNETPVIFADDVPFFYKITFNLLSAIGITVSVIVGLIVSLFTYNKDDDYLDEALLITQIRNNRVNKNIENEESITMNCNNI